MVACSGSTFFLETFLRPSRLPPECWSKPNGINKLRRLIQLTNSPLTRAPALVRRRSCHSLLAYSPETGKKSANREKEKEKEQESDMKLKQANWSNLSPLVALALVAAS